MRHLVAFSLQKRALVMLSLVAFLGIGFAGFRQLNIEAYPDRVPPTIVVMLLRGKAPTCSRSAASVSACWSMPPSSWRRISPATCT